MTNRTDKIDFKRELDAYRARRGTFRVVDVPDLRYLMIDGHGDPNTSPAFAEAIETLYPLAYTLKFAGKALGRDYVVMPLEGLWWARDMDRFTTARDKSTWDWTLMIMVPGWIDEAMFADAVEKVEAKSAPARLRDVRLETLSEGRCVQTLHVGSFDDEADVLDRMHHEFIPANGLSMAGKHHEIYLSDFRKVAPEKLRTILRQPVVETPRADPSPGGERG
ncbi:GyrI-like domain-containing protein [Saccharomonospora xinjiangensis]|uniref:GyrI-like domain-containing protein n=1 Tax=Saccharomonospora xinjiangensis TaxID=75294 RepID=UPI0035107D99